VKKLFLGLVALAVVATPIAVAAAPASAGTSKVPTINVPNVAKGKTIRVYTNNRGSKVVKRVNTLWKNGRRINDWSPRPGLYKVKSVITYQARTTTTTKVWIPDVYCSGDYDENGEWDPNLQCEDYGYWDWKTTTKLGPKKRTIDYDSVRVHADETPGCVSRTEFRAVKDGMTQTRVHRIFGTTGHVEYSGSGGVGREYETCTGDEWSYVSVDFNPRVWFKWQYISY
jgi:Ni/Co efflux regulator RcnB